MTKAADLEHGFYWYQGGSPPMWGVVEVRWCPYPDVVFVFPGDERTFTELPGLFVGPLTPPGQT